jgi:hypothetical protein
VPSLLFGGGQFSRAGSGSRPSSAQPPALCRWRSWRARRGIGRRGRASRSQRCRHAPAAAVILSYCSDVGGDSG